MKEPKWITIEACQIIHGILISDYGGDAGIREHGRLESALARPQNLFLYQKANLPQLAAAYAAGIVEGHPFVDGNKRTGFILAALFLEINGLKFNAPEVEVVVQTVGLASGKVTETSYAQWLESSLSPMGKSRQPKRRK
ncbi:MAG: type II toxin-antitoxin system death-on-curing family toxin [Verrucomicrobia bacterium]|jgi:death-on-curing protein|nr:type II toxin-antitoxin system death-on-curing family toxin [Verrucomicrobiota bacterium]